MTAGGTGAPGSGSHSERSHGKGPREPGTPGYVPDRALAVYAHPDDPFVSCGGTLARWAGSGCAVSILICTKGEKGSADPAEDTAALARLRQDEARAAARSIGCNEPLFLDYPDGELVDDLELVGSIVRAVRELKPEALVCPDPTAFFFGDGYVNHRDHRIVGTACLDAISPAAALPLYFPGAVAAHQVRCAFISGTLAPTLWIDITGTIDAKVASILHHESQLRGEQHDSTAAIIRARAGEDGRVAGLDYAESFRFMHLAT